MSMQLIKSYYQNILVPTLKEFKLAFIMCAGLLALSFFVKDVLLVFPGFEHYANILALINSIIEIGFGVILLITIWGFIKFASHSQTPRESQR